MYNPYFELLKQEGIEFDPCEWQELGLTEFVTRENEDVTFIGKGKNRQGFNLPNVPTSYENGIPQFTTDQLTDADPEHYGFYEYDIISKPLPLALNWEDEVLQPKKRNVHRYIRYDRFRNTLAQLMVGHGDVPSYILNKLPSIKGNLWENTRQFLKKSSFRIYYNRIPSILASMGYIKYKPQRQRTFTDILDDFKEMDKIYDKIKHKLNRKYFPNLRYTAVRLMQRHGIDLPYEIPRARTQKKTTSLDDLFDFIWMEIDSLEEVSCHSSKLQQVSPESLEELSKLNHQTLV